jgi:hypothetical protein
VKSVLFIFHPPPLCLIDEFICHRKIVIFKRYRSHRFPRRRCTIIIIITTITSSSGALRKTIRNIRISFLQQCMHISATLTSHQSSMRGVAPRDSCNIIHSNFTQSRVRRVPHHLPRRHSHPYTFPFSKSIMAT